ncbi:hypothetical protein BH09PSE5_BH09PSE5_05060 [soil metagenome]
MKPRIRHLALIALTCAAGAACAQTAPITANYECPNKTRFSVTFTPGGGASLQLPGAAAKQLKPLVAADGFSYGGDGYTLRGKSDWVTLTPDGKAAETCTVAKAKP